MSALTYADTSERLLAAGIQPMDDTEYNRQKLRLERNWNRAFFPVLGIGIIFVILNLLVTITTSSIAVGIPTFLGTICGVIFLALWVIGRLANDGVLIWHECPFNEYQRPVPAEAARLAGNLADAGFSPYDEIVVEYCVVDPYIGVKTDSGLQVVGRWVGFGPGRRMVYNGQEAYRAAHTEPADI